MKTLISGLRKRWSFRAQLAMAFGGVTILLVLLLGLTAESIERERLTQQADDSYEQLLSVLKTTLTDAIVAEDSALMSELTSRLGERNRDLLQITITDANEMSLTQWNRTPNPKQEILPSTYKTRVYLGDRMIGEIVLVKNLTSLKQLVSDRVNEVRVVMFGSLLAVALIVALFVWRLGDSITKSFVQRRVPQVRTSLDGRVLWANELGYVVLKSWDVDEGGWLVDKLPSIYDESRAVHAEVEAGRRTYAVHSVRMTDFSFVYLTFNDVTETRILTRVPNFNPNPVLKVTPEGLVTYANDASQPLLDGWTTSIGDYLPKDIVKKLVFEDESLSLTVTSGKRHYDLHLVCVPALDYVNVFGTDMTHVVELEDARERLVQKEKLAVLGGLVAGVAHELNTPIGVTLTAARLVQEETEGLRHQFTSGKLLKSAFVSSLNQLDEVANLVLSNANRAAKLIASFKGVAVDQSNAAIREIELRPYLQQIVTSLGPYLNRQNLSVEIQGEDFSLQLPAGPFSQVITNLLQNAAIHAYENAGGTVTISGREAAEGLLRLEIADQGKGISPEFLTRIFEPLFTTRLGSGGSGLGLHISYQIVQDVLGGTLAVESEVGVGTTFILELPHQ